MKLRNEGHQLVPANRLGECIWLFTCLKGEIARGLDLVVWLGLGGNLVTRRSGEKYVRRPFGRSREYKDICIPYKC